jgi:hypothetical protein
MYYKTGFGDGQYVSCGGAQEIDIDTGYGHINVYSSSKSNKEVKYEILVSGYDKELHKRIFIDGLSLDEIHAITSLLKRQEENAKCEADPNREEGA